MKISTGIPIFNTPVDPQGTENQSPNAIFHTGSKSLTSHIIDVSETAIIVKAYGFVNDASTITVCTVTTEKDGINYASPMVLNGRHVQLSTRNNVLVIDMTGKYAFILSDGLGITTCAYHESGLGLWSFGLSAYATANGMLEFIETTTVKPVVFENQVREYAKLSQDPGNLLTIHGNPASPTAPSSGLYFDGSGIATPLTFAETATVKPNVVGNVVKEDAKISGSPGNLLVIHNNPANPADPTNGLFFDGTGVPPPAPLVFTETATVKPNVVGNVVKEDVKLSADGAGTPLQNLLQIHADGLYYGISPATQFINQYVSSSHGSDSDIFATPPGTNDGTKALPWKTIQHAMSHLPEGTSGNIYLYRGDTFYTHPSITTDVINTLTFAQTVAVRSTLEISNRSVHFYPYDDAIVDAVLAWNTSSGQYADAYAAAGINFPKIVISVSYPTDLPLLNCPIGFILGSNGLLNFSGVSVRMGEIPDADTNKAFVSAGIYGGGVALHSGGRIITTNIPLYGISSGEVGIPQDLTTIHTEFFQNSPVSAIPKFCSLGTRYIYNSNPAVAPGSPLAPGFGQPWTYNPDNAEAFLAFKHFWPGLQIYGVIAGSSATPAEDATNSIYRSYRNLSSSIRINGA